MSEIKIRLNLVVPGATMLSTSDCVKMSKKEAYEHSTVAIKTFVKKGKNTKVEKNILRIDTRKSTPARQNISMSKEAYEYMIQEAPLPKYNKRVKVQLPDGKKGNKSLWETMTIDQKLKAHFDLIASDFNAISYSYNVLED